MSRDIPYHIYDRFLGHELTAEEREELERLRKVCLENRKKAAGGCCFATAGSFKQEADYITSVLDKKYGRMIGLLHPQNTYEESQE